ncbi:hypothetical protein COB72_05450 [bacterium]|nr:MAG: hypothetical protein COB72_05450 [bacterium]
MIAKSSSPRRGQHIEVSILIPVRNGVKYTRVCLASLFESMPTDWTLGQDFEVIVFDDASTDSTSALLAEYEDRITAIVGDGHGWYAHNNNAMAKLASGRWLCMLNNDTILEPGWLEPMLELGESKPGVGVIGNIHVFPNRKTVNHAGVVFNEHRIPRNLYDGLAITTPGIQQDRQLQAAMAACWITPKPLYDQLEGFDEGYRTGSEDVDYCQRVREAGSQVWIAGQSVIVHHGGSTPGRYAHEAINERRFLERWAKTIEVDWRSVGSNEGVNWPCRTVVYRFARAVWRNPLVKVPMGPVMNTAAGVRFRQCIVRRLVNSSS